MEKTDKLCPMNLGDISIKDFLTEYWQKRPLFIPQAFSALPEINWGELEELAGDEEVFSRLVLSPRGDSSWKLEYGPFSAENLRHWQEQPSSLLINGLNRVLPRYADLLEYFRFIPNWRIDDVMLSFSAKYGGVGPHVDQYDVFLIQAEGEKTWHLDLHPNEEDCIPGLDLKILNNFNQDMTWHCKQGDVIYLPPGVGHHGIAQSAQCTTLSVGFRMPRLHELAGHYYQYHLQNMKEEFLCDADLPLQTHCGEISEASLEKIYHAIQNIKPDRQLFHRWFGEYITDADTDWYAEELDEAEFQEKIGRYNMRRNEDCRFAFILDTHGLVLFVNGEAIPLEENLKELAVNICDNRNLEFNPQDLKLPEIHLLYKLYQKAYLFFSSK